ncbi:AAA family ATPase [Sedimenticola selenatireducens]|uniref:AAA family ATPase n=2 Tax=Sedimenticola TaxID=349742 RepID=A0A558CXF0_9GAMM|nr:AAA family ATPase [Sedimenticola selenatireducens]TVO69699.1 AAA family ATPase [Sedimenticola selenatireducens]TVT53395.1 MAG: AAA family ATPase [Sedimenticola thiotaurini]TVT62233.1 MAG: AAA family ATPase [Sedimenticola selenatireducens]
MTSLSTLSDLSERMHRLIRAINDRNINAKPGKMAPKIYTMKEAEPLIGRKYHTIRAAEKEGRLQPRETLADGRRTGYTLADINRAREVFGTRLRRGAGDDPIRIAVSNFKGGSAKTTTTVHAAQYLAEHGLRVLLVDCDPQASSTAAFGYVPDDDVNVSNTLLPLLDGEQSSLAYAIRETYWDSLDLIPSNLMLYNAEYGLAVEANKNPTALLRLLLGLQSIEQNYDVILLDPPPALGMISLSVMQAANALVVPTPPALYDIFSTRAFFSMLVEVVETLQRHFGEVDYKFVRLLVTRLDMNSETQQQLVELLPEVMGNTLMRHSVTKTAALDRAGMYGRSLYEVLPDSVPRKTWKRAVNHFNKANEELLLLIRQSWPSHAEVLREEGLL